MGNFSRQYVGENFLGLPEEEELTSCYHRLGRRESMIWRSHVGNPGRMETGRKEAPGQG